jgi:hypothetical protein
MTREQMQFARSESQKAKYEKRWRRRRAFWVCDDCLFLSVSVEVCSEACDFDEVLKCAYRSISHTASPTVFPGHHTGVFVDPQCKFPVSGFQFAGHALSLAQFGL